MLGPISGSPPRRCGHWRASTSGELVGREQIKFEEICDQCVQEKNAPHESGRGWAQGEDHSDVKVQGELPLDQDDVWVECAYGHRHLAVREGSERAANFGFT